MPEPFALLCLSAPFLRLGLPLGRHVVGRDPDCDFVLAHPMVSRRHAELLVTPPALTVTDLGSANGTWIDGSQIGTATVKHGQNVRFSRLAFVVHQADAGGSNDPPSTKRRDEAECALLRPHRQVVERLSGAQRRVFDVLLGGEPEKAIASHLHLSPHTVHAHIRAIFKAFSVHSRTELLVLFLGDREETGGTERGSVFPPELDGDEEDPEGEDRMVRGLREHENSE